MKHPTRRGPSGPHDPAEGPLEGKSWIDVLQDPVAWIAVCVIAALVALLVAACPREATADDPAEDLYRLEAWRVLRVPIDATDRQRDLRVRRRATRAYEAARDHGREEQSRRTDRPRRHRDRGDRR